MLEREFALLLVESNLKASQLSVVASQLKDFVGKRRINFSPKSCFGFARFLAQQLLRKQASLKLPKVKQKPEVRVPFTLSQGVAHTRAPT